MAVALTRKATIDHGIPTGIERNPKCLKETPDLSIRYVDVVSVLTLLIPKPNSLMKSGYPMVPKLYLQPPHQPQGRCRLWIVPEVETRLTLVPAEVAVIGKVNNVTMDHTHIRFQQLVAHQTQAPAYVQG